MIRGEPSWMEDFHHVFSRFRQKSSKTDRPESSKNRFHSSFYGRQHPKLQKYQTDIQTIKRNLKKSLSGGYSISKKYYLCHRKNDETFIETYADIAQLVEQLICNQPVVGSSPTIGSRA